MTPNTTPFAEIHLTAMDLALADSMTLSYNFGFLAGRLDINTLPDEVRVIVVEPEAPALETLSEYRVEMVCDDDLIDATLSALLASHPYEEPAYHYWLVKSRR